MNAKTYILWDWNGTLLDDTRAAANAINAMLRRRGLPEITMADYRRRFGFPVRRFYEQIGFKLETEDWDALAEEYHRLFRGDSEQGLRTDARAALDAVRARGAGQSILSALREDLLKADIAKAGITDYFDRIYGVDNLDGATKIARGHELMAALRLKGPEAVMIGDSLHDVESAVALGARCVLVAGGHQSAERLQAACLPVAETLVEAVRLALA